MQIRRLTTDDAKPQRLAQHVREVAPVSVSSRPRSYLAGIHNPWNHSADWSGSIHFYSVGDTPRLLLEGEPIAGQARALLAQRASARRGLSR